MAPAFSLHQRVESRAGLRSFGHTDDDVVAFGRRRKHARTERTGLESARAAKRKFLPCETQLLRQSSPRFSLTALEIERFLGSETVPPHPVIPFSLPPPLPPRAVTVAAAHDIRSVAGIFIRRF